jgi:MerR family transcriptional regulator, thiopeptide resistance regulator
LSRSAILYYESIGLLKPAGRSAANYRTYSDRDEQRLQQICAYRKARLNLSDILTLLRRPESDAASVLKRRLKELDREIATRRQHQKDILRLLQSKASLGRAKMMRSGWGLMQAAGFSDDDMHRWHVEFERAAPEDHQEFLGSLHIPLDEIARIREWSRGAKAPTHE